MATANTFTTDDLESDVARLTPGSSPRVLDEPVVGAVVSTVANHKDSMVKVSSTGI